MEALEVEHRFHSQPLCYHTLTETLSNSLPWQWGMQLLCPNKRFEKSALRSILRIVKGNLSPKAPEKLAEYQANDWGRGKVLKRQG